MTRFSTGFHLIECLMVLAIVSILAAFTLPRYQDYLLQGKRMEAGVGLLKLANALEKYYLVHGTYQGATVENLNFPSIVANEAYSLFIRESSQDNFLIGAKPLKKQMQDVCGTLTLDGFGRKQSTAKNPSQCNWQS